MRGKSVSSEENLWMEAISGAGRLQAIFWQVHTSPSQRVNDHFYSWIFNSVQFDNYTLDCDLSVLTRYGEQQETKLGYNLHYLSLWHNWQSECYTGAHWCPSPVLFGWIIRQAGRTSR